MRLIVTGTSGQVVSALRAAGTDDVAIIPVGRPELDLAAPHGLVGLFGAHKPDAIVNAAAYTAVDKAESEEALATRINGAGAGAVAAAARALGVPVLQISTDYVFDGSKTGPYSETDPVAPINAYGRSKLAGERAVAADTPDHAILRTSWVYAAEGANFLRTMLRLAETRPELTIVADQHGAPTYAPDIADAVIRIAQNLTTHRDNPALRGIFHMTGAGATTWAGFAEAIFAASAARGGPTARVVPIPTSSYPTPARRPLNSRLACSRLHQTHGIALPDWRDALSRCMDKL